MNTVKAGGVSRGTLQRCVADLDRAIKRGEVLPTLLETAALVRICQERGLTQEARRVSRWPVKEEL